jgi:hypothetical protein
MIALAKIMQARLFAKCLLKPWRNRLPHQKQVPE